MAGRLGRALLLAVAGASHGCASLTSPAEVMARGECSDYRSTRSPRAAPASCVEYNAYEPIYQARGATLCGILGVLHGEGTLEQQIVKGCQ